VGLIQPQLVADNRQNVHHIESLIEQAMSLNPQILCLPERWYYVDYTNRNLDTNLQNSHGEQYQLVQSWAKKYHIAIISGGIWESRKPDKPKICCYYFNSQGKECFSQEKIHLYGLEKQWFQSASKITVFHDSALDISFSILICFDLNISSDLAKLAVMNGAEVIFSPTLIRDIGVDNWNIYIRSRALENRVPVVSCNSIWKILDREFKGQSKIIQFKTGSHSPVQLIVDELDDKPSFLVKNVELDFPNEIRKERLEEAAISNHIKIEKK
jgi:predicted amidohydrolase